MRAIVVAVVAGIVAVAARAEAPLADAALIERGERIYYGIDASIARPGAARIQGVAVPAANAACVACHRRSGLGSSESRLLVPPVAGFMLFNPLLPQTGRRLPWLARDRTRPAYDEATLLHALNAGMAPDGVPLSAPMPRYSFEARDVAALAAYLRTLSTGTPPGVDGDEVVFATVTTPDVPASQVDDVVNTLREFFREKNAGTRHEAGRRSQSLRTEGTMYSRFRRWRLEHWALEGDPATWGAQLDARYRAQPVYALLSGISYDDWRPVHDFCERHRVPCLLPNVWMPPASEDFYSIYFSRGLAAEVGAVAAAATGATEVIAWTAASATGARQREAIAAAFGVHGIRVVERTPRADDLIVAALPAAELEARYAAQSHPPRRVYVLGGATHQAPDEWTPADDGLRRRAVVVTPLGQGAAAERQLTRARLWLSRRKMQPANEIIASNALLAAVLTAETLTHVDERFSREYCIEKIEHNLENIPPLTAYPRLSIGPSQRFAAKAMHARAVTDGGTAAARVP